MEERRPEEKQDNLDSTAQAGRKDKFARILLKFLVLYLCLMVIMTVIFQKILMLSLIPSDSMADTLMSGDLVISTRYDIGIEDIDRYDVLIFTLPDDPEQEYIKRVIGLPGETIEIRTDGKVYANGVELDDSFCKEPMEWYNDTYIVPEGCYFVMGDNRNNSVDSRYWGKYVPVENVLAKEQFIIIRLSDFGYKGNES